MDDIIPEENTDLEEETGIALRSYNTKVLRNKPRADVREGKLHHSMSTMMDSGLNQVPQSMTLK